MRPALVDGRCELSCDSVKLIRGTELAPHADAKHYLNADGAAESDVQVAVTPFYKEVFQTFKACNSGKTVNTFFHTHPLHAASVDGNALLSPPSVGDVVSHLLLSNICNFKRNQQMNTCLLMSFEGLYVYSILPNQFCRMYQAVCKLVEGTKLNKDDQALWARGEVPLQLIEVIKSSVFPRLQGSNDAFYESVYSMAQKGGWGIQGAPVVDDKLWGCRGCLPKSNLTFPFYQTIQDPALIHFIQHDNIYLEVLHQHGLHYDFYPAPFKRDVVIAAPSKLVRCGIRTYHSTLNDIEQMI